MIHKQECPICDFACRAIFTMTFAAGILAPLACDRTTSPKESPPSVQIISPRDGAIVADTVVVIVAVVSDREVQRVSLYVDGVADDSSTQSPWQLAWATDALADSSRHTLSVVAEDAAGHVGRSTACHVLVRHNDPPIVTIDWPPEDHWIDLDGAARPWVCRAIDPDEGMLPDSSVHWMLDGASIGSGASITQPPSLNDGAHLLEVRAVDSWGRETWMRRELHAFYYPAMTTPGGCLERFLLALRARDHHEASECLASGYLFLGAQDIAPQAWTSETEREAIAALLGDERLAQISIDPPDISMEEFQYEGQTMAKIEMRDLAVSVRVSCPDGNSAATRAWDVDGAAARIFLTFDEADASDEWRLRAWWDLHGAVGCNGSAPSWSELKAAALQNALCD